MQGTAVYSWKKINNIGFNQIITAALGFVLF